MINKNQPLLIPPNQLIADLNWITNNQSLLNPEVLSELELPALSDSQKNRIEQLGSLEIKSAKLGFYFEELIRLWIQVAEKFTLKAANLQVQNDKLTIGEFDFVVENHAKILFEHWEVSIKFYLCHDPKLELDGCCGTQLKDVFQGKVNKLKDQQLKLGRTQNGNQTLCELGVGNIEAKGLLKGMVFYNQQLGQFKNAQLNPFHSKAIWMYFSQWKANRQGSFVVLRKPFLFSLNSYKVADVIDATTICELLKNSTNPMMIAEVDLIEDSIIEQSRYWLLPNGWF